jgi:putative CGCGG family rSAM target protein
MERNAETRTERREETWSADLEGPDYSEDREKVIEDGLDAVRRTASGYFVNLVTHGNHGDPSEYLYDPVKDEFGDSVRVEYVDRCGCGGYVTRVHIEG